MILSRAKNLGRRGARTAAGTPSPRFFLAESILSSAEGLVRTTTRNSYIDRVLLGPGPALQRRDLLVELPEPTVLFLDQMVAAPEVEVRQLGAMFVT